MTTDVIEAPHESGAPVESQNFSEKLWPYVLVLVAVTVAVYANTLWNRFAFDDYWIIQTNSRVHQLRDLGLIWGTPYWPTFGSELGLYRPFVIFAYALQWAVADGQPWFFHGVNVVLHTAAALLVFALLAELWSTKAAFIGALLFAVHPVHTEAVANVVGQAELWAAVTTLGACVIYARRPLKDARVGIATVVVITILYALGLLSKEASITLPALLVLLDITQGRLTFTRAGILTYVRQVWFLMFVLAAAVVLYLSIRADVLGSIGGSDANPGLPFLREDNRVLTAFRAWPEYVRLLFFPMDLSADYSPAVILPVESLSGLALLGSLLLFAVVGLALLTPVRPLLGFPAAWFLITILTVSNLLFPVGVVVAERTLYTPSIAISAVAAILVDRYASRLGSRTRQLAAGFLILLCGLWGWRSVSRNPAWKTTNTVLFTLVLEHPESYRSAWALADQFFRRGEMDRSAYYWEAAYLLWKRDSQFLSDFANFSIARRDWTRAIELLEMAREMNPWVPRIYELLSFAYLHAGRIEDAIVTANEGIRLNGSRAALLPVKARAYEDRGDLGLAVAAWKSAIDAQRDALWVHRAMLARVFARNDQPAEALDVTNLLLRNVGADTLAKRTVEALRAAVEQGCFTARTPESCTDPLEGWAIALPPPAGAKQKADLQNATPDSK